jgi:hypothetical protein
MNLTVDLVAVTEWMNLNYFFNIEFILYFF